MKNFSTWYEKNKTDIFVACDGYEQLNLIDKMAIDELVKRFIHDNNPFGAVQGSAKQTKGVMELGGASGKRSNSRLSKVESRPKGK